MMHDFDGNSKLDGLEILKGLWHDSEHDHDDEKEKQGKNTSAVRSEHSNFIEDSIFEFEKPISLGTASIGPAHPCPKVNTSLITLSNLHFIRLLSSYTETINSSLLLEVSLVWLFERKAF